MFKLLAAVTLMAVGACSAQPAYAATLEVNSVVGSVVQLNGNCSGSLIYSNRAEADGKVTTYVLTAKHCIDKKEGLLHEVALPTFDADARQTGTTTYRATVKSKGYKWDLALLELVDKSTFFKDTVKLAPKNYKYLPTDELWLFGYPLGLPEATVTEGRIGYRTSLPWPDNDKSSEYLRATPAITGGNSGGPGFAKTDAGYQQVGVAVAAAKDANQIGLYVPVDQIWDFLVIADNKAFQTNPPKKEGGN